MLLAALIISQALAMALLAQQPEVARQIQGFGFAVQAGAGSHGGRVYLTDHEHIACFNLETGARLWLRKDPDAMVDTSPVILGRAVSYIGGPSLARVYGVDAATGKELWAFNSGSTFVAPGVDSAYLATIRGVGAFAVDAATGKIRWIHRAARIGEELRRIVYAEGKVYTQFEVLDAAKGKLIRKLEPEADQMVGYWGRVFYAGKYVGKEGPLVAVDAASDRVLWKAQTPKEMTVVQLTASQDYVAAALYAGGKYSSRQGLVRVYEAQTGRLLWEKELHSSDGDLEYNPLGIDRDRIYLLVPAKEEKLADLVAFDAASGKEAWRHTNLDVFSGPVAGVGDFVLTDNGRGTLYVLDRKSGVLLRKLSIEAESQ